MFNLKDLSPRIVHIKIRKHCEDVWAKKLDSLHEWTHFLKDITYRNGTVFIRNRTACCVR